MKKLLATSFIDIAKTPYSSSARMDSEGRESALVRPRLLLNILLDHAQGGASDTSRKVAWTPQRVLPVGGLHQFRV